MYFIDGFESHRRVKENEQVKKEAKEKGVFVDCKRQVISYKNTFFFCKEFKCGKELSCQLAIILYQLTKFLFPVVNSGKKFLLD